MKRRDFIRRGVFTSFVMAAVPAVITSCKKDDDNDVDPPNGNGDENGDENGNGNGLASNQIDISTASFNDLQTSGNYAYHQNFIIINTGSGFIALSRICTHQGCQVAYNHSNQNLPCPCHGSVFNTDGTVANGPATTSLTVYSVSRTGDILTIG